MEDSRKALDDVTFSYLVRFCILVSAVFFVVTAMIRIDLAQVSGFDSTIKMDYTATLSLIQTCLSFY